MYRNVVSPESFVVDPIRDGVANALWANIAGTPAVASNKFRFNADESLVRADLKFCRLEFMVNIPLTGVQTPADLVNDVEFGLKNVALGNKGKITVLLDQSEGTISFSAYDETGTVIETVTFDWDTDWNGTDTKFIIFWASDRAVLYVDGADPSNKVAEIQKPSDIGVFSRYPLNPWIKVTGAENVDVAYIAVDNAQSSSIMLI